MIQKTEHHFGVQRERVERTEYQLNPCTDNDIQLHSYKPHADLTKRIIFSIVFCPSKMSDAEELLKSFNKKNHQDLHNEKPFKN